MCLASLPRRLQHVNFEAEIRIPEEKGIIQVEAFGCSMNADGTMFYGMQVEAIMDRIKDNISLDTLSRLLVDVAIDSSTIIDSVLSSYQRKLLALIFDGDAANRDKVNLIIANEITPHLTAEEYMDKGEYENELKQVIGDTRAAFDVSEHDTLVFGAQGLLIAGPNARQHEPLLCSYLQFTAMDLFIRNFFNRMFLINDAMRQLRELINSYTDDPLSMNKIYEKMQVRVTARDDDDDDDDVAGSASPRQGPLHRTDTRIPPLILATTMTQVLSDDIRMLGEILGYMAESLESCEIPPEPADVSGRALYARLQIADLAGQLSMRVLDLKKTMEGVRQELAHLRHLAGIVFETRQYKIHESVQHNTRQLIMLNETNERMSATMRMLLLIFAGILAFEILDRITGNTWTVMDTDWFEDFANPMIRRYPVRFPAHRLQPYVVVRQSIIMPYNQWFLFFPPLSADRVVRVFHVLLGPRGVRIHALPAVLRVRFRGHHHASDTHYAEAADGSLQRVPGHQEHDG